MKRRCSDCPRSFAAGPFARYCPPCRAQRKKKPAKWVWTPGAIELLRERYRPGCRGTAQELAALVRFPKWVVTRKAAELNLCKPTDARPWTPDEEALLEDNLGARPVSWIARELGRPWSAVASKAKRLHLSRRIRDGYTLRELELCFGVDHRVIERWAREGKLRVRRRFENGSDRDPWQLTDADVLAFVREHPTAFELRRVDQVWFLDLVLGIAREHAA